MRPQATRAALPPYRRLGSIAIWGGWRREIRNAFHSDKDKQRETQRHWMPIRDVTLTLRVGFNVEKMGEDVLTGFTQVEFAGG